MRQSQMERGDLSRRDAPVLHCFSTFSSSSPTPVRMATHKSSKAQWLNNGRKMRALVLGTFSSALFPLPGLTGGSAQGPSSICSELYREHKEFFLSRCH